MKVQAIAFLTFILQQSGISIPHEAPPKGSIEGNIIRMGTGEPISGASVTLEMKKAEPRTAISTQSTRY